MCSGKSLLLAISAEYLASSILIFRVVSIKVEKGGLILSKDTQFGKINASPLVPGPAAAKQDENI